AIYAKHILRLRELDPLAQNPDARLRGIVLHDVMEAVLEGLPNEPQAALAHVRDRTAAILARKVPWPAARALWQARLLRAAPWFIATEADRASDRQRLFTEISGEISLDTLPFTLRGKADRIDIAQSGAARVYDYKTGSPPSPAQQRHFDKQLPLEAAMVERGGFGDVGAMAVERAAYIGLGSTPKEADAPLDKDYWAEFETLIAAMYDPDHGFTSRRAVEEDAAPGPYDLLARYGEWGPSDPARKERM
ncbi:MAG: PD-(D/E)XK nuclease family protein, partial [Pseudomonadota bacterium]